MSEEQQEVLTEAQYTQAGRAVVEALQAVMSLHHTERVFLTLTIFKERLFILETGRITRGREVVSSYGEMYDDLDDEVVGSVGLPSVNVRPSYLG